MEAEWPLEKERQLVLRGSGQAGSDSADREQLSPAVSMRVQGVGGSWFQGASGES